MRTLLTFVFLIIAFRAYPQETQSAEALLEAGVRLQESGDHHRAIVLFNQCIYLYPALAEAYVLRASSKEQLQELQSALTDYSLSLELMPDQYEVLLMRGTLLFRMELYERARTDFLKLLDFPFGETTTIFYRKSAHSEGTDKILTAQGFIKPQVYNYLGLIEMKLNRCERAIAYADSAILLNTTEADYYVNRALAKQSCNHAAFMKDFESALALDPEHPLALHNLAVLNAKKGSYLEAEQQLTEAIERDSTFFSSYVERGYYRLQRGNYRGALSDYNQALQLISSDPEVWVNRGITKEKLKDFKGAYSDFTHAIDLQENLAIAWLNRGNLFTKEGRYKEAIEDYTVAITFDEGYAAAYYNRAVAHHRLKLLHEACDDLTRAGKLGFKVDARMKELFCKPVN